MTGESPRSLFPAAVNILHFSKTRMHTAVSWLNAMDIIEGLKEKSLFLVKGEIGNVMWCILRNMMRARALNTKNFTHFDVEYDESDPRIVHPDDGDSNVMKWKVILTTEPKTSTSRSHLVIWAIVSVYIDQLDEVYIRSFDIPSE